MTTGQGPAWLRFTDTLTRGAAKLVPQTKRINGPKVAARAAPDIHHGLYLEAEAVEAERWQAP